MPLFYLCEKSTVDEKCLFGPVVCMLGLHFNSTRSLLPSSPPNFLGGLLCPLESNSHVKLNKCLSLSPFNIFFPSTHITPTLNIPTVWLFAYHFCIPSCAYPIFFRFSTILQFFGLAAGGGGGVLKI